MAIIRNRLVKQDSSFLLDTYPAALAYGFRQLKTGVDTVARIRRSSDNALLNFTATQITDGSLTAFCGGGDGFIETYYDLSGGTRHATLGIAALQDKIVNAGSLITLNGKPSAQKISTAAYTFSLLPLVSASVFSTLSSGSDLTIFFGVSNRQFRMLTDGTQLLLFDGVSVAFSSVFVGSATTQKIVGFVRKDATKTVDFYQNGGFISSTASLGANMNINDFVFSNASDFTQQKMQEAIVFDSDQTANYVAINSNINAYYGVY